MEYADGGDLLEYIKKQQREKKYIAETRIWHIFIQVM
jgi:hypothetical protein